MIHPDIHQLLETAVNSSCKLAVMMMFLEHGPLNVTPHEMAARVCRDIWSVETALKELADSGLLIKKDRRYSCTSAPEIMPRLQLLCATYADPLNRDALHVRLREIERYAPYRKDFPSNAFDTLAA